MISFRIEKGRPEDLDVIEQMEHLIFSDPWSRDSLAFCMSGSLYVFTVAKDEDGRIVGYLVGSLLPPECELCILAVDPSFRRNGVGRALLSDFLLCARSAGCNVCYLEVRTSNLGAIELYLHLICTEDEGTITAIRRKMRF